MNLEAVDHYTPVMVNAGHRVLQIHRFADDEREHVRRLERWADFPIGSRVIDMGCGVGEVARLFHDLRDDLDFYLVNLSQLQLSYSPEWMERHCGSFLNIPCKDQSFDGAMFCFSIGHEDIQSSLNEAARLVKSGGVVFVYDMVRISGTNELMKDIEYSVYPRSFMEHAASVADLCLDIYIEPKDDGSYGKYVIGSDYQKYFCGTIPAIWRFIKN